MEDWICKNCIFFKQSVTFAPEGLCAAHKEKDSRFHLEGHHAAMRVEATHYCSEHQMKKLEMTEKVCDLSEQF